MALFGKVETRILTDDRFAFLSDGAVALWMYGMLWSIEHLTDGKVPIRMLNRLRPDNANVVASAEELVAAGLWIRFYDDETGVTDNVTRNVTHFGTSSENWGKSQTTKEEVVTLRSTNAERQKRYRENQKRNESEPENGGNKKRNVTRDVTNVTRNGKVTHPEPEPEPELRTQNQNSEQASGIRKQEENPDKGVLGDSSSGVSTSSSSGAPVRPAAAKTKRGKGPSDADVKRALALRSQADNQPNVVELELGKRRVEAARFAHAAWKEQEGKMTRDEFEVWFKSKHPDKAALIQPAGSAA